MDRSDRTPEGRNEASRLRTLLLPVVVLLLAVAIVAGLLLGGVVQGKQVRVGPDQAPTTQPTVLIAPRLRQGCGA